MGGSRDTKLGLFSNSPHLSGLPDCDKVGDQPLFCGYLPHTLPFDTPVSHSSSRSPTHIPSPPSWALLSGWAAHPPVHTSHRWNPCYPPRAAAGSGIPCRWRPEQPHFWAVSPSGLPQFSGNKPTGGNMFRPAVSETVRRRAGFLSKEGQHLVPHHLTHFPHPQLQHCMDGTDYAHSLTHSQWVVTVVSHLLCSPRLFKAYHQVPRAGDDTFVGCLNSAANVPAPSLLT